jgi:localization factor PodJL
MEHRHERLATDLAERLRESEARATAWMEEARDRIAAQLAGRAAEQPPATPTHAFGPELFARSETEEEVGDHEPGPAEAEPTPAPAYIAADAQPEADAPTSDADFAPLSEPDEDLAFGEPPEPAPQIEERRPLSTREVIEQARLAARAVADQPAPHTAPQPSERRPTKRPARRMARESPDRRDAVDGGSRC